jgi:hypothetical protein
MLLFKHDSASKLYAALHEVFSMKIQYKTIHQQVTKFQGIGSICVPSKGWQTSATTVM